ncbi:MAG: hypothetical protein ABIH21_01285 [Patescibacteria group bacterium]
MSKTPNYDNKLKQILDSTELGERTCQISGDKWNFNEQEMDWCKKFQVPPNKYAPLTRMKQTGGFRTAFEIFWNKHMETGKPTMSYIHPDLDFKIVLDDEWHNIDVGTIKEYQSKFDSNKPFFDQYYDLITKVPFGARREWRNIKNTIGIGMWDVEDSYIVCSTVDGKRCMYTYYCLEKCEDITDGLFVYTCQNCWNCAQIMRCHSCNSAFESRDCMKCSFIYDCRNCENVYGGTNLRNKKYIWFNEQLSKEEWEEKVKGIDLSCRTRFDEYMEKFKALIENSVSPENFNINSPDCTGEYLTDCVRCEETYYSQKCTDCAWTQGSAGGERSYFISCVYPASDCWMGSMITNSHDIKFSSIIGKSRSIEYSTNCHDCENCFGCVGLKNKKFHIFNKEYSEDEYWKEVDKIKCAMLDNDEYGEFLPPRMSPTGIQFSQAALFYHMPQDEIKKYCDEILDPDKGAVLSDAKTDDKDILSIKDVPDCLADIDQDKYVGKPFMDEKANRRWSVAPIEFKFLSERKLPFPQGHYSTRMRNLYSMLNAPDCEQMDCTACGKSIRASKNMGLKRRVYCHDCYLKHLEEN